MNQLYCTILSGIVWNHKKPFVTFKIYVLDPWFHMLEVYLHKLLPLRYHLKMLIWHLFNNVASDSLLILLVLFSQFQILLLGWRFLRNPVQHFMQSLFVPIYLYAFQFPLFINLGLVGPFDSNNFFPSCISTRLHVSFLSMATISSFIASTHSFFFSVFSKSVGWKYSKKNVLVHYLVIHKPL